MLKKTKNLIKKWLLILFVQVPQSFFFVNESFKPALFWITFFCTCAAVMTVQTILGYKTYSDSLLISLWGFILGWVGVYTLYQNSSNKKENLALKQQILNLTQTGEKQ